MTQKLVVIAQLETSKGRDPASVFGEIRARLRVVDQLHVYNIDRIIFDYSSHEF